MRKKKVGVITIKSFALLVVLVRPTRRGHRMPR
jgi:hypothetical protein